MHTTWFGGGALSKDYPQLKSILKKSGYFSGLNLDCVIHFFSKSGLS